MDVEHSVEGDSSEGEGEWEQPTMEGTPWSRQIILMCQGKQTENNQREMEHTQQMLQELLRQESGKSSLVEILQGPPRGMEEEKSGEADARSPNPYLSANEPPANPFELASGAKNDQETNDTTLESSFISGSEPTMGMSPFDYDPLGDLHFIEHKEMDVGSHHPGNPVFDPHRNSIPLYTTAEEDLLNELQDDDDFGQGLDDHLVTGVSMDHIVAAVQAHVESGNHQRNPSKRKVDEV